MSTHYIMAAYLGPRRAEHRPQAIDRLMFVREHLEMLKVVRHSLDRITIVLQTDEYTRPYDRQFEQLLPRKIQGADVDVVVRPNDNGLSYTALADAVDGAFDFTIFNEDDYVFTLDYFDTFLRTQLTLAAASSVPSPSFLCGCVRNHEAYKVHAAVSSGIAHTSRLVNLPRAYSPAVIPQVAWSQVLLERGPIVDWLHDYATAYRLDDDTVRWIERKPYTRWRQDSPHRVGHADEDDPFSTEGAFRRALLMPIQTIDLATDIRYWDNGYKKHAGRIGRDGRITWLGETTP